MSIRYPAPKDASIEALLAGLVTAPTHVTRAQGADPHDDAAGTFAEFVTDDNELAVLAFADHKVVNFVGGAIVSLDLVAIQDASGTATVHEQGFEGFREVANSLAECLNSEFTATLRLGQLTQLPGQASDEAKALSGSPRGRRVYRVTVDDYGEGMVILYFN